MSQIKKHLCLGILYGFFSKLICDMFQNRHDGLFI